MAHPRIGSSSPRPDAWDKLTGRAQYVDDLRVDGLLHGITIRSPLPRARVLGVTLDPAFREPGLVVVGPRDLPGRNLIPLLVDDQPALADAFVNHAEEPLLLLAHADPAVLERARRAVRIELEPLPAVLDLCQAMAEERADIHPLGPVVKEIRIAKGDPESVWSGAAHVVEDEVESGAQEQLYLEPQGMIAWAGPDFVTVTGSLQCPYYVQHGLCAVFGLPAEKVRVIQAVTGGGFGGKEEYPTVLAVHAALLALKAGRPVKMVYDRAEDLAATTKRHPSRSLSRAAFDPGGRLLALDVDFNLDAGAYVTLTPVVLSRGALHAAGPYRCDHIRVRARAWATNTPPHGAFRGFGAPQSCLAIERLLDKAAAQLGLDPAELRLRNLLRPGDTTATGQVMREEIDLTGLVETALEQSDYRRLRTEFARANAGAGPEDPRRGVGLAVFLHGAGFTGSGEKRLASRAGLELDEQGVVQVLAASTEIGQGAATVFQQIVCGALGVTQEQVRVAQPDTAHVPDSGPTVASRTTMVVGGLVERAALALRAALAADGLAADADPAAVARALRQRARSHGGERWIESYQQPDWVVWDEETYRGDAYPTFAWAAYVAQVAVDPLTGEACVEEFTAVQDIGRVVNPLLAAGQIEGGVAQGIGFALLEDVRWRAGRMANNRLSTYIIPTALDLPRIRVHFRETPAGYGPAGAKGVGELPLDGTAPAVLAALDQALGARLARVPALPEQILPLLTPEATHA
ncbi:MAG: xanthine dehydrogenase family protein molybdopterin-binding subunit [Candidatus Delongbacteria bacterium]